LEKDDSKVSTEQQTHSLHSAPPPSTSFFKLPPRLRSFIFQLQNSLAGNATTQSKTPLLFKSLNLFFINKSRCTQYIRPCFRPEVQNWMMVASKKFRASHQHQECKGKGTKETECVCRAPKER